MLILLANYAYTQAELLLLLPLSLLVVYLAAFRFRQFLFLMVFFIPLSMSVKNLGGGIGASFPVEIMLALSALVGGAILIQRSFISKAVIRHPVTVIIWLQLIWIAVTVLGSSYHTISLKFLIARLAYLLVFYFIFLHLFRNPTQIRRFFWMYLAGFLPVMIYSLYRLAGWGLSRSHSPEMAEPFFDDHTVFGACLAMLLPATLIFWRRRQEFLGDFRLSRLIWLAAPLAVVSLALSFSRAAWMSAIAALGMYVLLRLKLPFRWLVGFLLVFAAAVWVNQDALLQNFRSNKVDSGDNVLETAASVTNVTTDESNKERVNRWASALRMHEERPWLGWGPGTYEKNYGIFQMSTETTRISTWDGDRGDAHSEYLGVLSEQGIPGLVLQLLLFLALVRSGMRAAYRHQDPQLRNLSIAVLLGLITYFIHGGVNSFLDLDKAASLFWAMAGMVVALDLAEELGARDQGLGASHSESVECEDD
jgi:O-antigen ligase